MLLNLMRKTALYLLALPLLLIALGTASNQLVLWANHDTFPVMLNAAKVHSFQAKGAPTLPDGTVMLDETHCLMTNKTHLNLLADVFDLGNVYSVGDGLLYLGGWSWTFMPFVWGYATCRRLYALQIAQ